MDFKHANYTLRSSLWLVQVQGYRIPVKTKCNIPGSSADNSVYKRRGNKLILKNYTMHFFKWIFGQVGTLSKPVYKTIQSVQSDDK